MEKAVEREEGRVLLMYVADLGQRDGTCCRWFAATMCALHCKSAPETTSQMMMTIDDVQCLAPLLLQDDRGNHPEILIVDFPVVLVPSNAKYKNDRHLNELE